MKLNSNEAEIAVHRFDVNVNINFREAKKKLTTLFFCIHEMNYFIWIFSTRHNCFRYLIVGGWFCFWSGGFWFEHVCNKIDNSIQLKYFSEWFHTWICVRGIARYDQFRVTSYCKYEFWLNTGPHNLMDEQNEPFIGLLNKFLINVCCFINWCAPAHVWCDIDQKSFRY